MTAYARTCLSAKACLTANMSLPNDPRTAEEIANADLQRAALRNRQMIVNSHRTWEQNFANQTFKCDVCLDFPMQCKEARS